MLSDNYKAGYRLKWIIRLINHLICQHEYLFIPRKLLQASVKSCKRRLYLWGKKAVVYKRVYNLYKAEYIKKRMPILVYQMAKCGSTSIKQSLRLQRLDPIYRIHLLTLENLYILYPRNVELLNPVYQADKRTNELLVRELRRYILTKRKRVKIITPVREPIARNLSLFFENLLEFHIPSNIRYDLLSIEELTNLFIREVRHSTPLIWFDLEMKETLGIDIYDYPFSQEKGYLTIEKENIDLLVLKIEIDDSIKETVISGFLNLSNFQLARSNTAENKVYAAAYKNFIKKVALPMWYVETMCNSKYTRHFYSNEEIKCIRATWCRNLQN